MDARFFCIRGVVLSIVLPRLLTPHLNEDEGDIMSDDENIVRFPGAKRPDSSASDKEFDGVIPPKEMLSAISSEVNMSEAVVIGWTDDDDLFIATSHPTTSEVIWLLELAKAMFVNKSIYG